MTTQNLATLSTAIENAAAVANKRLEDLPSSVQGGWATAIAEAKTKLKTLKGEYKSALLRNGVAILLEGDALKISEFVKLVRDEGEGLAVDAGALYRRLAEGVEPTFSDSRQWGVQQTYKLTLELKDVMEGIGLTELPMVDRKVMPVLPTTEDVANHIRTIVREVAGDELNRLYIEEMALKEAFEIRYTGTLAPVLILNANADEAANLAKSFTQGTTRVTLKEEDEINKKFLYNAFKEANKSIRTKK
jgi:hypothetical protein